MERKSNSEVRARQNSRIIREEEIKYLLQPGEVGATLEMTVRDSQGEITEHRGPMLSKSFVRQFIELLFTQMYQVGDPGCGLTGYDVRDTGNVVRTICASGFNFDSDAGAGVLTHGIIVGTGNTAATIDDFVIETLINEGVGGGQLQYSAVTFGAPAADAAVSQFTITRDFANGSGGPITVNECGLYVQGYVYNTPYFFMTIRDVIGGGIAIPNGKTLTLNYRPQATA